MKCVLFEQNAILPGVSSRSGFPIINTHLIKTQSMVLPMSLTLDHNRQICNKINVSIVSAKD
jgi:hypothetical protein